MSKIKRENIIAFSVILAFLTALAVTIIVELVEVPVLTTALSVMLWIDGIATGVCTVCLVMAVNSSDQQARFL